MKYQVGTYCCCILIVTYYYLKIVYEIMMHAIPRMNSVKRLDRNASRSCSNAFDFYNIPISGDPYFLSKTLGMKRPVLRLVGPKNHYTHGTNIFSLIIRYTNKKKYTINLFWFKYH